MNNEYLYHLIFTLFKFTLQNFIFLKIIFDTVVSQDIFFFYLSLFFHFTYFYIFIYF